jgi:hypothetical protein
LLKVPCLVSPRRIGHPKNSWTPLEAHTLALTLPKSSWLNEDPLLSFPASSTTLETSLWVHAAVLVKARRHQPFFSRQRKAEVFYRWEACFNLLFKASQGL